VRRPDPQSLNSAAVFSSFHHLTKHPDFISRHDKKDIKAYIEHVDPACYLRQARKERQLEVYTHFTNSFHTFERGRTNREIELILAGFPPFHRESILPEDGRTIPFPMRDARDITRGAWIVAFGITTGSPLASHNMKTFGRQHQLGYSGTWKVTDIYKAFGFRRALRDIKDAFSSRECVERAFILIGKLFGPHDIASHPLQMIGHGVTIQALFPIEESLS